MKRFRIPLPLILPRLSDPAATALIDVLTTVLATLENHYRPQIRRHRKRLYERALNRALRFPRTPNDPPF